MPERTAKPLAPGKHFHEIEVIDGMDYFSSWWREIPLERKIAQKQTPWP